MKKIILVIVCFIIQVHVFSQKKDSIFRESELKGKMYDAWYNFDTLWTRNIFPSCLMENHLKLSCAHCEYIYLDVRLKIDSSGNVVSHQKTGGEVCGKDFPDNLVKPFLEFFYFLEFPPELRNIILEVRLGNGLKC